MIKISVYKSQYLNIISFKKSEDVLNYMKVLNVDLLPGNETENFDTNDQISKLMLMLKNLLQCCTHSLSKSTNHWWSFYYGFQANNNRVEGNLNI